MPSDSQVYVEAPADVRRVLFGVDISLAEVLWAQQNGFDAVIAHHPLGDRTRTASPSWCAAARSSRWPPRASPRTSPRRAISARLEAIARRTHMSNVNAIVDSARLFGMPLCNVHLACDIITRNAIIDMLRAHTIRRRHRRRVPRWFDDFAEYAHGHARPQAWVGSPGNALGRWTVAIAGGTNGGFPVFSEYFRAGVDTIFAMHIDEGDLQRLRAAAQPRRHAGGHRSHDQRQHRDQRGHRGARGARHRGGAHQRGGRPLASTQRAVGSVAASTKLAWLCTCG